MPGEGGSVRTTPAPSVLERRRRSPPFPELQLCSRCVEMGGENSQGHGWPLPVSDGPFYACESDLLGEATSMDIQYMKSLAAS